MKDSECMDKYVDAYYKAQGSSNAIDPHEKMAEAYPT